MPGMQIEFSSTPTTYTKYMLPYERALLLPGDVRQNRRNWAKQRVENDATALQMLSATKIPVPTVIETGEDPVKGYFITTSRLVGCVEVLDAGKKCRLPGTEGHTDKFCQACKARAEAVADNFIKTTVLPELAKLPKSNETGLNGTVIPSPWVTLYDKREHWPVHQSIEEEFSFYLGDLGPTNVMVTDDGKFDIVALFDLENAGYQPQYFQDCWTMNIDKYYAMYSDKELLDTAVQFLENPHASKRAGSLSN